MNYQWDDNKAKSNYHKHRVDFADAVSVFSDDYAVSVEDNRSEEDRFVTIGLDFSGRILVVVYTYREDTIRLISARKATNYEQTQYEG